MKKYGRQFHFLLDEQKFEQLERFCHNQRITKSEFFRLCIDNFLRKSKSEKIFKKDNRFKSELLWEVRRFGNNLNQIAHKLNIALINDDIRYTDELDIKQAIEDIKNIKSQIKALNILLNKRL